MATNKPDNETRALLDTICVWIVDDLAFMPIAAAKLRERFEAATSSRGMFERIEQGKGASSHAKRE